MGEHAFIVDYEHEESQVLAHAFHLEGVRFTPRGSLDELAIRKTALITLDPQVDEGDRMLSATIVVGSKFGSKEQMTRIKEKEEFLLRQATTFDFASWKAQLVPPTDPPRDPEVHASINDLICLQEANQSTPPLGQTRLANSHTHATFEGVTAAPRSEIPLGGLTMVENLLTEDHETRLVDFFGGQVWAPLGNRAVCQYGFTYDFKNRNINAWVPFPEELAEVLEMVAKQRGGGFPQQSDRQPLQPPLRPHPSCRRPDF